MRDFWAMVWEQGVEVVAMLTGVVEHGRQKCHPYWPDKQGPKNKVKFGDVSTRCNLILISQQIVKLWPGAAEVTLSTV